MNFSYADSRSVCFRHPSRHLTVCFAGLLMIVLFLFSASRYACGPGDIRYSSSSNRIYVEQPVTCTLTDLTSKVTGSILELVDTASATWILRANLILRNGAQLDLHSTDNGGDVNELRLLSNPGNFIYIQPNYGTLDVNGPLITSWDETIGGPDTNLIDGRAHLKALSFLDDSGVARESTVNIDNAEIAFLGYSAGESYGLALRVRAKRDETFIFDQVDAFGKLTNSYVHDNYMGFYSWGAFGVTISNNEVANNISYGIDPHDNSDQILIKDNNVHDNGNHGIICSQHCDHLTITGNTVVRNRHGIMLHRSVSDTLIANNDVRDNRDAGIALFESFDNVIRDNIVTGNRNGLRLSVGSHDNLFQNNTVSGSSSHGIYFYKGSDIPDVTNGRVSNNLFVNNNIEDSAEGFKIKDADNNEFTNNIFTGGTPFKLYQSVDNVFINNNYAGLVNFTTKGNSITHASTTIDIDENIIVNVNSDSDITLTNGAGRVLAPEEPGVPIDILPSGTLLKLNTGNIGSKSQITALDFRVSPESSQISILNPVWLGTKTWSAVASSDALQTDFTIGDLSANTTHTIKKDGLVLQKIDSDANGVLTFTDSMGTAGVLYRYSVEQGDASSNPITVTLLPSDDAYVRGGSSANINYGGEKDLLAKNKGENNSFTRESFLKFDLSGLSVPTKVILTLPMKVTSSQQVDITLSAVEDTSWTEDTITYASKPAADFTLLTFSVINTTYQFRDFDITDYVKAKMQNGDDVVSLELTALNSTRSIFKTLSKDGNSNFPVLKVTY